MVIGIVVISRIAGGRCVAVAYRLGWRVLAQEVFSFGGSIVVVLLTSLDGWSFNFALAMEISWRG